MALRVPVLVKLLGAHMAGMAAVAVVLIVLPNGQWQAAELISVTLLSLTAFFALALMALRPLRDLETVATRVWRGDFGARVGDSSIADRDLKRIGGMMNLLLDGLTADRARMRLLASSVIAAGDRERAMVARELHESTAQQLAALKLYLASMVRSCDDPALAEQLRAMQALAGDVLEEVRLLSHTVHPRVLDDVGLPAALEELGRQTSASSAFELAVIADVDGVEIPPPTAAALYRVAQAAVHNVHRHADARHVTLRLVARSDVLTLEIADDGRGFDVDEAERRRPGMGLFTMRERVALVGGEFEVQSDPGLGARISVTVPLRAPATTMTERSVT